MRGQESEAYEIDANACENLKRLGFVFARNAAGSQVFEHPDHKEFRALVGPGTREKGVLSYGEVVVQAKGLRGDWQTVQRVNKESFAAGKEVLLMLSPLTVR